MGKKINLNGGEIKSQIQAELDDARDYYQKARDKRMASIAAFHREAIGTEMEGRSKATSGDVMEAVEWVMPHVLRQVLASDDKIQVRGPDDVIAKGLKQYAREQLDDQGGFRFFYDWCKDALIGDNGFVKIWWKRVYGDSEEQTMANLTPEELAFYDGSPDYELHDVEQTGVKVLLPDEEAALAAGLAGEGMPEPQEVPSFSARVVHRPILESSPVFENMPSYEFICAPECRRINDSVGKGHRKWILRGELDQLNEQLTEPGESSYFSELDQIPARVQQQEEGTEEDDEKQILDQTHTYHPDWREWRDGTGPKAPVEFIEYYTQLSVGDELVQSVVWLANGHPIRAEENDEGVNICTWSPMLNPHHLYGVSYGTLVKDIQNIKTVMIRALLDGVGFSIDKAWIANSASGIDLAGLQRIRPGRVVIGNRDLVEAIDIQPMDPRLFSVLDYLDQTKEGRTGGFKPATGAPDADSKTATGTQLLQQASFSRIDLVVLIFAEVGMRDLYQKTISLTQQNLDRPVKVMVDGQEVILTPENIQGDYKARSSMGIQVDFNQQEYARLKMILTDVMSIYNIFPFMFPAEKMYNLVRKMFAAGGFKDTDEMISPPPPSLRSWFPGIEAMAPELQAEVAAMAGGSQNISLDQGSALPDEQMAMGQVEEGM